MGDRLKVPIYMKAPMTSRTGELFAYRQGYESVVELADSLPPGAQVLDVGAGKSSFGLRVCHERDDVEWTNADIRYFIPGMVDQLSRHKPPNLRFVPTDVLHLMETFPDEQFERVYSYWLLPHVSMAGRDMATQAARNILKVANPTGEVVVGPCRSRAAGVSGRLFSVDMTGLVPEDLNGVAADIASASTFRGPGAAIQYLSNQLCHRFERDGAMNPEHLAGSS